MNTRMLCLAVAGLLAACAPVEPTAGAARPQRCDAAASQALVGSQVGAVDFQAGANVRVVCTTCSTTMDVQPERLNVRFNQATGVIERVDCG